MVIGPEGATALDTLTCEASGYEDPDGDADRSITIWTVDGAVAGTGSATLAGVFTRGQVVACEVTPSDGHDSGPPRAAELTVENAAPAIGAAWITPEAPTTGDTLTASSDAADPDGDALELTYAWTVDGAPAGADDPTLDGSWFDRGASVEVTISAGDGALTSAPVTSAPAVVVNSAPGAPTAAITPDPAYGGAQDLSCEVSAPAEDPDGDPLSYAFAWTVGGGGGVGAGGGRRR